MIWVNVKLNSSSVPFFNQKWDCFLKTQEKIERSLSIKQRKTLLIKKKTVLFYLEFFKRTCEMIENVT